MYSFFISEGEKMKNKFDIVLYDTVRYKGRHYRVTEVNENDFVISSLDIDKGYTKRIKKRVKKEDYESGKSGYVRVDYAPVKRYFLSEQEILNYGI